MTLKKTYSISDIVLEAGRHTMLAGGEKVPTDGSESKIAPFWCFCLVFLFFLFDGSLTCVEKNNGARKFPQVTLLFWGYVLAWTFFPSMYYISSDPYWRIYVLVSFIVYTMLTMCCFLYDGNQCSSYNYEHLL